jgi:hypothetical protein
MFQLLNWLNSIVVTKKPLLKPVLLLLEREEQEEVDLGLMLIPR